MAIPEAYWVLNDKVNLPESQIGSLDEVLVPGGERWAGIGVENGDLAFSNARELLKPQEFGEEFQVSILSLSLFKSTVRSTCITLTLISVQLSLRGPSEYNNGLLKKLHKEFRILIELPACHCCILRAHVVEQCYENPSTL